jgi:chromosomal replication initiation ATPase DnaA
MMNTEKEIKEKYINEAMEMIATASSTILNIPSKDMMSTKRDREIVDARRIAYAIARFEFKFTLNSIGRYFNKNHATILHQVNTHEGWIQTEDDYRSKYDEVKKFLFDEDSIDKMQQYIRTKEALNKQIQKHKCKESE